MYNFGNCEGTGQLLTLFQNLRGNMTGIKEFQCQGEDSPGIPRDAVKGLSLTFPDAYMHADTMAAMGKAIKEYEHAPYCVLPFCHTVEAETLGGMIHYGDEKTGPRVGEPVCSSLEELLELPAMDFSKGRIHEVLRACEMLKEAGEETVLQISGPFTIINGLTDIRHAFRAMRKNQELMKEVFFKLKWEILSFVKEAEKHGVRFISYGDAPGGMDILGPGMSAQVVEDFTYDFLKEIQETSDLSTMVLLCPKTSSALLETDKAELREIRLSEPVSYGEACLKLSGRVRFAGQMCMKNRTYCLRDRNFKELILK